MAALCSWTAQAPRRRRPMNVSDIMTTNVITVRDGTKVEDAARLLARHRISGLPVVDQSGAPVGVVTEYDLIAKKGTTVADIMTRDVISVSPETDVDAVAHLLASRRVRRVPVVAGGRLVGIVSRSDLVRQIALRWVCTTCGEVVRGEVAPESCPCCGAPDPFSREVEPPGA
jgi:CBS domain-containing protein